MTEKNFSFCEEIVYILNIFVYFAKLCHYSWQKGANGSCNGLIRRYGPTNMDFRNNNRLTGMPVQCILNSMPRNRLGCMIHKKKNTNY